MTNRSQSTDNTTETSRQISEEDSIDRSNDKSVENDRQEMTNQAVINYSSDEEEVVQNSNRFDKGYESDIDSQDEEAKEFVKEIYSNYPQLKKDKFNSGRDYEQEYRDLLECHPKMKKRRYLENKIANEQMQTIFEYRARQNDIRRIEEEQKALFPFNKFNVEVETPLIYRKKNY